MEHLVRDCPVFEGERVLLYDVVHEQLAKLDLMPATSKYNPGDAGNGNHWYFFCVGASVPDSFVDMQLETPTHFARPADTRFSGHIRKHWGVYRSALAAMSPLLLSIDSRTRDALRNVLGHSKVSPDPILRRNQFWSR